MYSSEGKRTVRTVFRQIRSSRGSRRRGRISNVLPGNLRESSLHVRALSGIRNPYGGPSSEAPPYLPLVPMLAAKSGAYLLS